MSVLPPSGPGRRPVAGRPLRSEFALAPGLIHLDAAAAGPLPRRALVALGRYDEQYARRPVDPYPHSRLGDVRSRLAADLGGDADEIVLTTGAAHAHTTVLAGLALRPGDEIVTTTHECFTARGPQQALADLHGIRIVRVDPGGTPDDVVARFAAAITPATRVLQWPAVSVTVGARMPTTALAALAAAHGACSVVDAGVALGWRAEPLPAWGVDMICASLTRYQCGPPGTGLLWIRNRVRPGCPRLPPFHPVGSIDHPQEAPLPARAEGPDPTYDLGGLLQAADTADPSRAEAVVRARSLWRELGAGTVQRRLTELGDRLRAGAARRFGPAALLGPADPAFRSPVVAVDPVPGGVSARGAEALAAVLAHRDVRVAATFEPGPRPRFGLRLSPHLHNDPDELERALDVVVEEVAGRRQS